MTGERGMVWVAGAVTIVSDNPSIRNLGPALWNYGLGVTFMSFDEVQRTPIDGILVVDARRQFKRAIQLLRQLGPQVSRDAVVLARPRDPDVYRTVRSVSQGVVLYDPIDTDELSDVLEIFLSRRRPKAS